MTGRKARYMLVAMLAATIGVGVGTQLPRGEGADSASEGDAPLQSVAAQLPWPQLPVQAATAQGFDNFAVATGPVQEGIEAFYFLDFLTGDLRATALNTRQGKFGAFFEYNIAQDFQSAGSKNPKYLMVTGVADIPRGRGNSQLSRSVVYITEATSGQMAAYVMPWNSSLQAGGKMQTGTFLKIAEVQLRSAFVRDQ